MDFTTIDEPMTPEIGFIGAGRMAGAIIDGLIAEGVYSKDEIVACAPSESTRKRVGEKTGITMYEKATDIAPLCDVLVLAVAPKDIAPLFTSEGLELGAGHLLISIVAGVTIDTLQSYVPDSRIVRVMPNHCCMVLEGAAGYAMGKGCTEDDKTVVEGILAATGFCTEVREDELDAVGAVSGSSPAFMYMVLRGLAEAGVKHGLPEKQSLELAAHTMMGAGRMALESGTSLEKLIDGVCSPGGSTIEGVKSLEGDGLEKAFDRAVDATVARSKELGKE